MVAVSLDCADPRALVEFYLALLGGRLLWAKDSSAGIEVPGGSLVAQRVEGYEPPRWPGTSIVHLDLTADDIEGATAAALTLGAVLPDQADSRWRVLLDPAGHPFCLTPFTTAITAG